MNRYSLPGRPPTVFVLCAAILVCALGGLPATGQPADDDCETCPRSPGYWLTHPDAWPVDELTIGGTTYSQEEATVFLHDPPYDDPGLRLLRQLVAAELNVAAGVNTALVDAEIDEGNTLIEQFPLGSAVDADTAQRCDELAVILDEFNSGLRSPLAVELVAFDARLIDSSVHLVWTTASELNNAGFEVEHASGSVAGSGFTVVGFVAGSGTTDDRSSYTFRVDGLEPGMHAFRLRQLDFDGTVAYGPTVEVSAELADSYVLGAAYPNPFNPSTTIRFGLKEAGQVNLSVFDPLGRQVATLTDGPLEAGSHEVSFSAEGLPSGNYVYRLETRFGASSGMMVLLK